MTARRPGLFRGAELPRLMVLAGVMLAGWAYVAFYLSARRPPPAPPVPQPAPEEPGPPLPLPERAEGLAEAMAEEVAAWPAFAPVTDKAPLNFRENAAYITLLEWVRGQSPAELAAKSRRDLIFLQLIERPDLYRGVPVHLTGTARMVYPLETVGPEFAPGGRLYQAEVFTVDSQNFPYGVVFEDYPAGLPEGPDVHAEVAVDGYFFKLLPYQAGDKPRFRPVLIGRVHYAPPRAAGPGAVDRFADWLGRNWMPAVVAVLFGVALVRWAFLLRRNLLASRPRPLPRKASPSDEIAPEALSQWLDRADNGPEEDRPFGGGEEDD